LRLLAGNKAPESTASLVLTNRFSSLGSEEPAVNVECGDDEQDVGFDTLSSTEHSQKTKTPEISSVASENEHELLRFNGRIGGRRATVLIDSGSTHDFISKEFVERHRLPTQSDGEPLTVTLADGTRSRCPLQTVGPIKLVMGSVGEQQSFTVFPLSKYDAILGKPWLTKNNPSIDFRTNVVQMPSESFVAVPEVQESPPSLAEEPAVESLFISGSQASHALRQGGRGFLAWVSIAEEELPNPSKQHVATPEQSPESHALRKLLDEYGDLFPDELPDELPPERSIDHGIEVEHGAKPPSKAAYRLPKPELDE